MAKQRLYLSDVENSISKLDGYFLWKSKELEYLGMSERFMQIAKVCSKQLPGTTDYDLAWCDYADQARQDDAFVLAGQVWSGIEYATSDLKTVLPFNVNKYPLFDEQENIIGVFANAFPLFMNSHHNDQLESLQQDQHYNHHGSYTRCHQQFTIALTRRESQCLFYVLRGNTCRLIANKMCISERTAEDYVNRLKYKFNVTSKPQLIESAIAMGYLSMLPMKEVH